MKVTNFDILSDVAKLLTEGRVGFYWEKEDAHPVIEVFMTDSEDAVLMKKADVERRLADLGIAKPQIDVDMETLDFMGVDGDYHRIMIYFSFENITDVDFMEMIQILQNYGTDR